MARNVTAMLPSGWGSYSPQQKINWFNANNVSIAEMDAAGVPNDDINWMLQNGYTPSDAKSGPTQAEQDLIDLYRSVLGREPDAEGLEYWKSVVGPTLEESERTWWMGGAQEELARNQERPSSTGPGRLIEDTPTKTIPQERPSSTGPGRLIEDTPVKTVEDSLVATAQNNYFGDPDTSVVAEEPAPLVADAFTTAKKGGVNADAAARLKDQLTQQASAYKVKHNATFSREQDKIISDLANQLSQFGVTDLADIVQGTRMVVEDVYDPSYYGDGSPSVIGEKLVEVSTVVNKRTGEEIPMNKLNNAAGSGFTWYNLQFVNGAPVFYASTEETGWNAFKQDTLPAILNIAKFIPGVAPFAIAAEAALALDEGKDFDDVLKDTAVKVVLHEAASYVTDSPSMFDSKYYDTASNLLSDMGEDISDILAGEGTVGPDPNFPKDTSIVTKPADLVDVTSGVGFGDDVAGAVDQTVTVTGKASPITTAPPAGGIATIPTTTTTPTQEVKVEAKKPEDTTAPPVGGITTIPTTTTTPTQEVKVEAKKPEDTTAPAPPIGEVKVTGSKEDIERDTRESVIAGPLTPATTTPEVTVEAKKPEDEKPPGPLTTGLAKVTAGNITELTVDEAEALVKAGLLTTTLIGSAVGSDTPTIPTTTVDTELINTIRPGVTIDLNPTIPGGTTTTLTPGQQVYTGLGIGTGKPTTAQPTTPTTGIGSLPVPTYKPPPFLGGPAPGVSRITPPVLTADPTLTQSDFDFAAAEIAKQQAAFPPITQPVPANPFEAGLAKATTVAKRAGGIVALRGGGMPLAFMGGGMTGPVNQPRMLSGGGDGMSDSIPATIDGTQPARLADGEFVIPADVVADIGNGSSKAGATQLYAMMDRVRQARHGTTKQPPEVNMNKVLPV